MNSDLFRKMFLDRYVTIPLGSTHAAATGEGTVTNVTSTPTVVAAVPIPSNCKLKQIAVANNSSTGTLPGVTIGVYDADDVLLGSVSTSTALTTKQSAVSDVNKLLSKGFVQVKISGTPTGANTFLGAVAVLVIGPAQTDD